MGRAITMTDAELLDASRRGEHQAFGALVERYQRMVSAVSYSRTRDQALSEDVAQETFLAAWRQLDQLREPGRLRSWLCGIARNLARKARRRTDREVPGGPELLARDNPFDDVCEAQAERVVGEALARVPDTYRDVLVLYYRESLSVREIAHSLGISEAAVLQRLSRGRQYLANGVTSLVEKSLVGQRQRPKRNLVAAVLAALPAASVLAPSRADASTGSHSHGGSMIKLALAAAAFVAAGTTALVVTRSPSEPAASALTATATPTTKSRVAAAPKLGPRVAQAPAIARAEAPSLPPGGVAAPEPDTTKVLDRATIEKLGLDRGPGRGPANAPVTITMFTDLKCPYCAKMQGAIDQLFDEYPGKLRLVVKQLPVHQSAELAAEATYAADAQGKFRELNEMMIANHEDLSKDAILGLAGQAGLDVGKLRDALDKHTYADSLEADKTTAAALEFQGTPAFVINGRRIVGAYPIAEFRKLIEDSLKVD
ncbi:MAG: sigma-70 family RNA polymerase sigma factor [Kofleriaceae bacterium]